MRWQLTKGHKKSVKAKKKKKKLWKLIDMQISVDSWKRILKATECIVKYVTECTGFIEIIEAA